MSGCNCTITYSGASTCGGSAMLTFLAILESFLKRQCDIEDPCGHIRPRPEPDPEYDFIVCGLGSAGAIVANRLSEVAEWKVLALEAGVNEPTLQQVPSFWRTILGTEADWQYKTEPEEKACLRTGGVCSWNRGKVCGGTSTMNGMVYVRGSRKDFDNWEKNGCPGWGYDEVLPYFKKSENNLQFDDNLDEEYHGRRGYQPVSEPPYRHPIIDNIVESAKTLGYDIRDTNGEKHTGFDVIQTTSKNGVRYSTCRSFLRPVQNRPNLHIMLKTFVNRVLVDPVTKKAYGVEVITPEGETRKVLARKEVILSAGSINSPKLLLLSGIGNKDDLENVNIPVVRQLPGVGENLIDHLGLSVEFTANGSFGDNLDWASTMEYFLYRRGPLSTNGVSLTGFINSKYANTTEDHPDIQLLFKANSVSCGDINAIGEQTKSEKVSHVISVFPVLLRPKSRGFLKLNDNNPKTYPKLFARYLTVKEDLDILVDGVKFVLELAKTQPMQELKFSLVQTKVKGCENFTNLSESYWECAIQHNSLPGWHQVGTCKMGPASDPEAVVNPELRVHGIEGLRVIDASIMPQITSGNTNAPSMMIGEKGSDMIKTKWLNKWGFKV